MNLLIKSTFFILSYISIYGTPSFLAAPSTHDAAKASLISSRGNCILLFFSIFSYFPLNSYKDNAKIRNISLLCKFLGDFFCGFVRKDFFLSNGGSNEIIEEYVEIMQKLIKNPLMDSLKRSIRG